MKRKRRGFKEEKFELDLTPAISVALILVLIFMTGATQIFQTWLTVSSPKVRKAAQAQKTVSKKTEFKVAIHLKKDGSIILNEKKVSEEELNLLLPELLARSVTRIVLISADSEVEHGKVVEMIDLAKQKGAIEVALIKRR